MATTTEKAAAFAAIQNAHDQLRAKTGQRVEFSTWGSQRRQIEEIVASELRWTPEQVRPLVQEYCMEIGCVYFHWHGMHCRDDREHYVLPEDATSREALRCAVDHEERGHTERAKRMRERVDRALLDGGLGADDPMGSYGRP
ncbi:MAG TPA: hypothetical protein VMU89_04935 [Thermomicrobiaceae bacterium]|nr:hypothetical protein [Thermomicrobiaceae bacterium]